jgi:C4-dicarboxylate-binding protein DctP
MPRTPHTPTAPRRRLLLQRGLAAALTANAAALLPLPAAATKDEPILIQFSHVVTAETPKGKAAQRFKELAEARSAGRVRVEIFSDSRLYKDREELDALKRGAVQMLAPSLSKLGALSGGDMEVFDLPFLFKDEAAFRAVTQGPAGVALLRRLEKNGILGLAYWENGFKVLSANRPLQGPTDVRGLKMRVQASRVLVAQMKALGAAASISPLIDVYAALRSGELDGQENTPSNIYTQRLHGVQTHLALTRHGYLGYAVIVNQRFWLGLPAAVRTTLEGALRDATLYGNQIAEAENREALRQIAASGRIDVYTPTPQELAQWREAMAPVWREAQGWISAETLAAVKQAAGAPP